MKIDKIDVGERIRAVRTKLDLSMKEFADLIGSKKSTVNSWERGLALPKREMLTIISEVGNTSVNELLFGDIEEYVHLILKNYFPDVLLSRDEKKDVYSTSVVLSDSDIQNIVNEVKKSNFSYDDEVKFISLIRNYLDSVNKEKQLGHMLEIYEYERNLNEQEVAHILELDIETYKKIKKGRIVPTFEEVKDMEKKLQVPSNFLLCLPTLYFLDDSDNTKLNFKNGVDIKYTIASQEEYEIIQSLHNLTQNELKEISNLILKFQKRDWDIF